MLGKEIKQDPIDFLVLFSGFAIAAALYFSFPYQVPIQEKIMIGTGFFYFGWGLFYHYRRQDLCVKIVIEYFLFAILGTSIVLSTILRG